MKGNISVLDGILRLFGGILLGALAGVLSYWIGAWAIVFVPFAIILFATAMSGECPLYRMLGISTSRDDETPKEEPVIASKLAA